MDRAGIDRDVIGQQWQERGFTCDLWVDPPGQVWADFLHDVDELMLVLEGSLLVEIDERAIHLGPGDEFLIPAASRHTVRNVGEGTARWLYGYRAAS
jgi:mannose-6-phosphate isomerase-like protein (cupin superfamily)